MREWFIYFGNPPDVEINNLLVAQINENSMLIHLSLEVYEKYRIEQ